jgi:uncharacterized membrane protein
MEHSANAREITVELAILNEYAIGFVLRWLHILAGITWIGLLYYFNFVQGEFFKEAEAASKSDAIQKLVPRALWWFRWGAMFTFLTGVGMLAIFKLMGFGIITGAVLGTIMFLNVWVIIWPNQKIVIASAKQVAAGGEPMPEAAGALGKAGLASRTNTLFSIPMAFFMASSSSHFPMIQTPLSGDSMVAMIAVFGLIGALTVNGIIGKTGPMTSVKGVIHMGVALTVVLYLMIELL